MSSFSSLRLTVNQVGGKKLFIYQPPTPPYYCFVYDKSIIKKYLYYMCLFVILPVKIFFFTEKGAEMEYETALIEKGISNENIYYYGFAFSGRKC